MRQFREPRRVRMLLAAVALLPLIVALLACGAMGDSFTEGAFTTSCTNECAVTVDRAQCETYCACAYRHAESNGRLEELNRSTFTPGQPMAPVLLDVMGACGSAIYDANFRGSCVRECSTTTDPATCTTRCDCVLREIRGPGPESESTRFLIANIDVTPPTPAGQARMDAAIAACLPEE